MFAIDDETLTVEGRVSAEVVDDLVELLDEHPAVRTVDLSRCEHLHTAGVQLMMKRGLEVASWPATSDWVEWLKTGLKR